MRSPIIALTWEIWRQGRTLALTVAGIIALCSGASVTMPGQIHALGMEPWVYFLMICTLGMVFAIFHHAEFNRLKSWHGFPYRLFVLPLRTVTLVAWPMLLGIAAVELTYLAWAGLVFAPLGIRFSFWPAYVLGAGLMCYQAIVWTLAGFRITRIIALALAGMVLMNLGGLPLFLAVWPNKNAMAIAAWVIIGLALGAFLGAWYFVEKQRRGGGRGRGRIKEWLENFITAALRRRRDFPSPASAQFWFEWRRAGLLLPACTGAALLLVFGPVSWFMRHEPDAVAWILGWLLALPVILATVVGVGFVKPDFWTVELALPTFLAARPLSSGDVIVTKLKVAAWAVVAAWSLVLLFLAAWISLWAERGAAKELWVSWRVLFPGFSCYGILVLVLAAAIILSWRGMVNNLWAGQSGSLKLFAGVGLSQLATLILAICGLVFWVNHFHWQRVESYVTWTGWMLALAAILKLWAAVFTWRLITPRRTWGYAELWLSCTAIFVSLAILACPNVYWFKHLVVLAALLPVPLARLALAPVMLARNRHRI